MRFTALAATLLSSLLSEVYATNSGIGPVTDLRISNAVVSPDGFSRDAVVVQGQFPSPLIKGNKVSFPQRFVDLTWLRLG